MALKVGLSAFLTLVSYKYLETPARIGLRRPDRRGMAYAFLAAGVLLSVGLGYSIRRGSYVDGRDSWAGPLTSNEASTNGSVILMGDSHASMYGAALRDLTSTVDWKLTVMSLAAENPLPQGGDVPGRLWAETLAAIRRERPDVLVLSCHWGKKLEAEPEVLAEAVRLLHPHVGRLVLMTQPPIRPESSSRASLRQGVRVPAEEEPYVRARRERANAVVHRMERQGVEVFDVESLFTETDGTVRVFDSQGRELYQDADHLSGRGAGLVIEALRARLAPFSARGESTTVAGK